MRGDSLLSILFVIYCLEAGLLFTLAPWSPAWDRAALQLPSAGLRSVLLHPLLRGAFTGFGVLHLVWGAHDVEAWLGRRRRSS